MTCVLRTGQKLHPYKVFFIFIISLSPTLSLSFRKPVATKSRPLSFHYLRERQKEWNISNNERTPLGKIANLHCSLSLSLSLSLPCFFWSMLVKLWLPSLYLYKTKIFCMSVESLCVHLLEHLDEVVHNFSILVYQKI